MEGQVFERAFPVVLASPKDYIYVGACICAHAQYKCVGMCVDNIHVEAMCGQHSCGGQRAASELSFGNHLPCFETQSLAGLDLTEYTRMPSS